MSGGALSEIWYVGLAFFLVLLGTVGIWWARTRQPRAQAETSAVIDGGGSSIHDGSHNDGGFGNGSSDGGGGDGGGGGGGGD